MPSMYRGSRLHMPTIRRSTLRIPTRTAPSGGVLVEPKRWAATAETDETLNPPLTRALATGDQTAGEAGAARRRIAISAILLDDDPDLKRLADALASPRVRLLTRGRADT